MYVDKNTTTDQIFYLVSESYPKSLWFLGNMKDDVQASLIKEGCSVVQTSTFEDGSRMYVVRKLHD